MDACFVYDLRETDHALRWKLRSIHRCCKKSVSILADELISVHILPVGGYASETGLPAYEAADTVVAAAAPELLKSANNIATCIIDV